MSGRKKDKESKAREAMKGDKEKKERQKGVPGSRRKASPKR
jgi:hypothetical protein